MKPRSTSAHAWIFAAIALSFMVLAFAASQSGSACDRRDRNALAITLSSITGPFTGATAREGQSCCKEASVKLFPFCGAGLLAGVAFQFLPLRLGNHECSVRYAAWIIGLLAWFVGVPLSLLHAFS